MGHPIVAILSHREVVGYRAIVRDRGADRGATPRPPRSPDGFHQALCWDGSPQLLGREPTDCIHRALSRLPGAHDRWRPGRLPLRG